MRTPEMHPSQSTIPLRKRRQMTPEAGRAVEILGHAIEYLKDMHQHEGSLLVWEKGYLAAIDILKSRNREIYLACPILPTLEDRLRSLFFRMRPKQ